MRMHNYLVCFGLYVATGLIAGLASDSIYDLVRDNSGLRTR